ncbi:EAL domain-containing protein [Pollutimonas sp. H1-120]|uniref:EAL domain-containing protein n=1 Tax=Pollutimonas sp. H1-120 TaxID=3148824 RepID=UPI003B51FDB6
MSKAHYWLLLKIAEKPKAFTYGVGILTALLLILATAATAVWVDENRIADRHDNALQLARAAVVESATILDHLIEHDYVGCDDNDLMHLNGHLLQSRFIREIGVLDADNRLVCSTALGRLSRPVKGNYPVVTLRSGRKLLKDVPLQMVNEKVKATILQRDNFNVVLSPYLTEDIYRSADAVWLRTIDGLVPLRSTVAPQELPRWRERAGRFEKTAFTLHDLGYELVSQQTGTDVVLQSRRSLAAIARDSGALPPAMLAGSLLIAVLTVGTLAPYVMGLRDVRNRIHFLCDDAHILLVYQPIFDLTTMKPVGCEVLMRMKEKGKVWMPDQVIPAILDSGLARRFDHIVTQKAIRELAGRLPAQRDTFRLALNYFPDSIDQATLIPVLQQALQAAGRSDLEVCIEITEHSLSSNLIAEVGALKAQGFRIAIDDFGTGYSNLKSVTKLSPDVLKIDRSFVFELEDATVRSNLISEIVNIARAVDARAVAEGIENMEQAQLLAALGVQYGQGYALARPMELEPFLAFMAKHG